MSTGRFDHLKILPFELEKAEKTTDSGRPRLDIKGWASTERRDLEGEVIEVGFFDDSLADFLKRPVMPWLHKVDDLQGRWTDIKAVPGRGYWVEGCIIDFGTELDKRRLGQVEEGLVTSLSVGFRAKGARSECGEYKRDTGAWHWQRNGLLREVSLVPFPCNEDCFAEVAKGLGWELAAEVNTEAGAVPDAPAPEDPDAEAERMLADLQRGCGGIRGVLNITRHWLKAGRILAPEHVAKLAEVQTDLAAILETHPAIPEPYPGGGAGADQPGALSGRVVPRARVAARP